MEMNDYIKIVNEALDRYIQIEEPESLFKSMKYTVMLPGKRLRPIMCLETCKMFGGNIENALPTACAIEMLHSQTLIHDDLPCMDNDDFRRGKPSNHKVFGEAIAVLAGDALLTYAPEIITKYSTNLSSDVILKILNEYFKFSGARGVIAGQVKDIESENSKEVVDKENTLHYLHIHKTSDLFQLSMRTGAIISGASEDKIDIITDYAKKFGLAFQIADDVLDEISTFEQMGKTIGKDKAEGKLTYVSLYGLDNAKCKLSCLLDECCDTIDKQGLKSEIFNNIICDIRKRVEI